MRCLIMGGGGFIGSNLSAALLSAGHRVRIFEYPHVQGQVIPELKNKVEWAEGDFINPVDVDLAMADCDIVFHLISTTLPKNSNDNPTYDVETNLLSTVRMLESARRHKVGKIVFASSGGTVYGVPECIPISESHPTHPICSYGIVKLAIENYLRLYHTLHDLDYCVLRLANPYGEGQRTIASQGAVAVFLHRALNDEMIEIWGDGSVIRDYIHISDVTAAMLAAIAYHGTERILNIGSGAGTSLNDLIAEIGNVLGRPIRYAYLGGRRFDVTVNVLDISLAKRELGWRPQVSLNQGARRTLEWMESRR